MGRVGSESAAEVSSNLMIPILPLVTLEAAGALDSISTFDYYQRSLSPFENAKQLVDSEICLGPLKRLHPESATTAATS